MYICQHYYFECCIFLSKDPYFPGNLEMFLSDADKSLEFKDKISAIETSCEVEYNGSQVFKQVQLLVRKVFLSFQILNSVVCLEISW